MEGITTEEAVLGGALVGGAFATIFIGMLVFYILVVIACWKIFTKAGEAGWKALIPIYNVYILYKISGISFWTWCFIPVIVASIFNTLAQNGGDLATLWSLIYLVIMVAVDVKIAIALAKAFGKGTGFMVGLVLLPNIFQIILGFSSAKYVGTKN